MSDTWVAIGMGCSSALSVLGVWLWNRHKYFRQFGDHG